VSPGVTVADRLAGLIRGFAGAGPPVRLRAWDGSEAGPVDGPVLVVRNRRALRRLLWAPGELGLARAYVTGDLDVDGDLADGFRRAWRMALARPDDGVSVTAGARARAVLVAARLGALGLPPKPPASEARLSGRLHTRRRDRAAISHHYDLSNDFYRLLLDDHMAYSAAYFTHQGQSLHDAQTAKLDLICRKLDLEPGMRLLDVGCGWGSLILYAARRYGVHATGITLSAQQRDFIAARVTGRQLAGSVDVRLQDYREFGELPASREAFDAVSSIEMGEHVGEEQYPEYAGILLRALKPTGRLLLQQMSRGLDSAPGGGPFIEAYIAPDMHMRPLWQTLRYLQDAGFEVRDVEAMREHYVRTVERWIDTFENRYDEFVALQGEEVARVWRLYLVGGALAFEEGRMGVDQVLAVKRGADGVSAMPWTRPWAVA
jgi:cyclopropane-fatty-acyl-phospholipid synthase